MIRLLFWLPLAMVLILIANHPASAQSKAARWLIGEQVSAGCQSGKGTFHKTGIIERDLTGDGKLDLLLDHGALVCNGQASRSMFCGAQTCSVNIYVRQGLLLQFAKETLSIGVEVTNETIPTLKLHGHGGLPYSMRWNGKSFQ